MAITPIDAFRNTVITASAGKLSGSGTGFADALGKTGGSLKKSDVYQELDDYVKMTPAQRIREELLKKLGLTEEDLAAKPPEEQQAIQQKLTEMIQQQMKDAQDKQQGTAPKVGQWVDTVA